MITIREGLGEWLKSMLWIDNYIFLNSFLDRELHNLVLTFMVSGSVRKKIQRIGERTSTLQSLTRRLFRPSPGWHMTHSTRFLSRYPLNVTQNTKLE